MKKAQLSTLTQTILLIVFFILALTGLYFLLRYFNL